MTDITVESVKSQTDYIITMQYINNMLEKVIPDPQLVPGSILVGKKYATKYNEEIKNMLSSEYIDKDILKKLSEDVRVGVVAKVHFHIGCWCRITVDEGRGIAGSAGRSVHIRLIVTWRRNVKRSS